MIVSYSNVNSLWKPSVPTPLKYWICCQLEAYQKNRITRWLVLCCCKTNEPQPHTQEETTRAFSRFVFGRVFSWWRWQSWWSIGTSSSGGIVPVLIFMIIAPVQVPVLTVNRNRLTSNTGTNTRYASIESKNLFFRSHVPPFARVYAPIYVQRK